MSRDYRHNKYTTRNSREDKTVRRKLRRTQEREAVLRHAVRTQDREFLEEEYDETDDSGH